MKAKGIKLTCELANGEINTWHTVFNKTVQEIIKEVAYDKNWFGGKFLEIYLEFNNNNSYYKVYLDVKDYGFNQILGS